MNEFLLRSALYIDNDDAQRAVAYVDKLVEPRDLLASNDKYRAAREDLSATRMVSMLDLSVLEGARLDAADLELCRRIQSVEEHNRYFVSRWRDLAATP